MSEGSETFSVELGADTGTEAAKVWVKSTAASAEATIAESDPITVSISGPSTVDEGDAATYTVSLSPSGVTPSANLTVSYDTGNEDDTATAGMDYTAKSATLTFTQASPGDKIFTVQTTADILSENSETFTVTISSPTGGGGQTPALGTSSVTTTIGASDRTSDPPEDQQQLQESVDIWLTVDPDSVNEGAGSTAFKVTAEHNGDPQSDPVTIQLALAGTATPGSSGDYTAPAQATVTIPANQTSGEATLTLNILDDDETEGDETIIVGGSYEDLVIRSAVITIHDDEATYLSITGPAAEVAEGSNATFTVTLSKAVTNAVTVAWNDVVIGTATRGNGLHGRFRYGDLPGQLRGWGHPDLHHSSHRRQPVGGGGDFRRCAGRRYRRRNGRCLRQEHRRHRRGHHRRERPHHDLYRRPDQRGRG